MKNMKKLFPYILVLIIIFGAFAPVSFVQAQTKITVQEGAETWQSLSTKYGVTVDALMKANAGMSSPKGTVLIPNKGPQGFCTIKLGGIPQTPKKTTEEACKEEARTSGGLKSYSWYEDTNPATNTPTPVKPMVASCNFEEAKKANPVPKEQCQQNGDLDKGLVQCGREIACEYQITTNKDGSCLVNKNVIIKTADPDKMCKFSHVIELINNIIKYILILAIPIVAIMFAYAGIMLLFSGGDPGAKTKAKETFLNALIGLVLVVGAVLIIKTILTIVGYKDLGLFF